MYIHYEIRMEVGDWPEFIILSNSLQHRFRKFDICDSLLRDIQVTSRHLLSLFPDFILLLPF